MGSAVASYFTTPEGKLDSFQFLVIVCALHYSQERKHARVNIHPRFEIKGMCHRKPKTGISAHPKISLWWDLSVHNQCIYLHLDLFAGDATNKYYYPVLIPIGITGNILSILVSFIDLLQV